MTVSKAQTYKYEADMEQLMHLIAHSMYSDQEAFVRELISNAADAKEKYDLLSLKEGLEPQDHCIYVDIDKDKRSFVIKDTGVGMSHDEIVAHLGTVAKSGTKAFLSKLKEAKEEQKASLIGQFGIGFYSSFVVLIKLPYIVVKQVVQRIRQFYGHLMVLQITQLRTKVSQKWVRLLPCILEKMSL